MVKATVILMILILWFFSDKVAVKVRDRMVVGIGSLDEYGYSDVPVINGRGFAVKIADEKDLKAFLSELNAQNG